MGARDAWAAAANNAAWCALVCRADGLSTVMRPGFWSSPRRSPDAYPDAVTLAPGTSAVDVLDAIDASAGASVKDSFADLDLSAHGFAVLFEAQWLTLPAVATSMASSASPTLPWLRVDARNLSRWLAAHGSAQIRPDVLDDPDVRLLLAVDDDGPIAVAALNRSGLDQGRDGVGEPGHDGVVGLSNVLALRADPELVWSDLVARARDEFGPLALVGYETGADLVAPVAVGFEQVGPLRVWMRPATTG